STTEGSELAAAGNTIAQLGLDTSQGVNVYSVSSGSWSTLPALPNGSAITSVEVANINGGVVVTTDRFAQPWYWSAGSSKWINFGGPGDQFLASGPNILGLTPNRQLVFLWPGGNFTSGGYWYQQTQVTQTPIAKLISGPDNENGVNWGIINPGNDNLWF